MGQTHSHQFESGSDGGQQQQEGDQQGGDRPEWLPEQFQSPEDMAKAYNELRTKMSQDGAPEPQENDPEPEPTQSEGGLSEEDRALLQEFKQSRVDSVMDEALGNPEEVLAWAEDGVDQDLRDAWDAAVESGNPAMIRLAGQGLRSAFVAANGVEPSLVSGGQRVPNQTGAKPFGSSDEVVAAMRDPRYRSDPKYQAEVYRRLAVTP